MLKRTRLIASLLTVGLTMSLWGVAEEGKKKEEKPAQTQSAPAAIVKDPVCGMDVEPGKAAGKAVYKDKTYYFCSLNCKTEFEKNPAKYVK
jgi:YHS domain-containing protein